MKKSTEADRCAFSSCPLAARGAPLQTGSLLQAAANRSRSGRLLNAQCLCLLPAVSVGPATCTARGTTRLWHSPVFLTLRRRGWEAPHRSAGGRQEGRRSGAPLCSEKPEYERRAGCGAVVQAATIWSFYAQLNSAGNLPDAAAGACPQARRSPPGKYGSGFTSRGALPCCTGFPDTNLSGPGRPERCEPRCCSHAHPTWGSRGQWGPSGCPRGSAGCCQPSLGPAQEAAIARGECEPSCLSCADGPEVLARLCEDAHRLLGGSSQKKSEVQMKQSRANDPTASYFSRFLLWMSIRWCRLLCTAEQGIRGLLRVLVLLWGPGKTSPIDEVLVPRVPWQQGADSLLMALCGTPCPMHPDLK
ncbi:uncharacterized protein LOC118254882 [Cygnus atratus]|uniref:uncharacterized protein LOC118254882 n=1 Tax=Cygnus atratus TaxID=8868 RepID=UPI0021B8253A|nr:uncharacterized protein LOC118254882 [Cygnus atratus]